MTQVTDPVPRIPNRLWIMLVTSWCDSSSEAEDEAASNWFTSAAEIRLVGCRHGSRGKLIFGAHWTSGQRIPVPELVAAVQYNIHL